MIETAMIDSTTTSLSTLTSSVLISSKFMKNEIVHTPHIRVSTNFAIIESILNDSQISNLEPVLVDIWELYIDALKIAQESYSRVDLGSFFTTQRFLKLINLILEYFRDIDACLQYCDLYKVNLDLFTIGTRLICELYANSIAFNYRISLDEDCSFHIILTLFRLKSRTITHQLTKQELVRYQSNILCTIQTVLQYCKPTPEIFELVKLSLEPMCSDYNIIVASFRLLACNFHQVYLELEPETIQRILSIYKISIDIILRSYTCRQTQIGWIADLKSMYHNICDYVNESCGNSNNVNQYYAINEPTAQSQLSRNQLDIKKVVPKNRLLKSSRFFKKTYRTVILATKRLKC